MTTQANERNVFSPLLTTSSFIPLCTTSRNSLHSKAEPKPISILFLYSIKMGNVPTSEVASSLYSSIEMSSTCPTTHLHNLPPLAFTSPAGITKRRNQSSSFEDEQTLFTNTNNANINSVLTMTINPFEQSHNTHPLQQQHSTGISNVVPGLQGYTVQDNPHIQHVYNGVNPSYPNLQVISQNPPIFCVPDFLTAAECDFLVCVAQDCFTRAPVVGKGAGEVSKERTSSTCYLAREDLPEYLRKISLLTGKPIEHCELPQVGRYYPSEEYKSHFDAFDLSNEDGKRFASNGGQRVVTVLTYLNDVPQGGHTAFPALNMEVTPKKGMALVFFPATVDGLLDRNALHAAMPAVDVKYVSQVWIRQSNYEGVASKRIFTSPEQASLVQKSLAYAIAENSEAKNDAQPLQQNTAVNGAAAAAAHVDNNAVNGVAVPPSLNGIVGPSNPSLFSSLG